MRGFRLAYAVWPAILILGYQNCAPMHAAGDGSVGEGSLSSTTSSSVTPTGKMVPIILAGGTMGRTLISCDGGQSWLHDHSDNDAARCFVTGDPNAVDCDHNASNLRNLDYANGYFYASFGWGYTGSLRRSRDGVNWETVRNDGYGDGVAAFNDGTIALIWGKWQRSTDSGQSWMNIADQPTSYQVVFGARVFHFGPLLLLGGGEATGTGVSTDEGATFNFYTSLANDSANQGVAAGNGLIVTIGFANATGVQSAAVSRDSGVTWTTTASTTFAHPANWTGILFDGTQFVAFTAGTRWTSADGLNWVSAPMKVLNDPSFASTSLAGAAAFDPVTKNYVLLSGQYTGSFYAKQKAFYSRDAISWTEVDASSFTGGHPIRDIKFGQADSSVCQ